MQKVGIAAYDEGDYDWVIGCDEAGYGAWAGDLCIGMVAVPRGWTPTVTIGDSKQLTPTARERAYEVLIADTRLIQSVHTVGPSGVDRMGVYRAVMATHEAAVRQGRAAIEAEHAGVKILAIVDGNLRIPGAVSLPKADAKIPAVSAASILAKVWHDREMVKMAALYPDYGFASSQGYGTKAHEEALDRLGPCAIHRRCFAPVARALDKFARKGAPDIFDLMDELSKEHE